MKKTQLNSINTLIYSLFSLIAIASTSSAAIVVTHSFALNAYETTFTASSTDLINSGQTTLGTVTSDYNRLNGNYGTVGVLYDGVSTGNDSTRALTSNLQSFTITFELDTGTNTLGYDISSILSYAGNPDGRARQEYQVFYSLVGSSSFVQLIPDNYTTDRPSQPFQTNNSTTPGDLAGGSGEESKITINVSGLSGVDAVRFVTSVASGEDTRFGASVYREFDVNGIATVPETSTALLSGIGMLALLRRRRP